MSEALRHVQEKLKRADDHIQEINRGIEAFLGHDERTRIPLHYPGEAERIRLAQESRPVDPRFSILTGEVLYQLRSSLDHMVCALLRKDGNEPTSASQFPISKNKPVKPQDVAHYEKQIKGIRSEGARACIDRYQPFTRCSGSDVLLRLQKMCNHDKHRALVLHVVAVSEGRMIESKSEDGHRTMTVAGPLLGPTALEPATLQDALAGVIDLSAEFYRVTKTEAYIVAFVAFSDWVLGNLPVPVFDGLSGMHREVSNIVHSLAAHL